MITVQLMRLAFNRTVGQLFVCVHVHITHTLNACDNRDIANAQRRFPSHSV